MQPFGYATQSISDAFAQSRLEEQFPTIRSRAPGALHGSPFDEYVRLEAGLDPVGRRLAAVPSGAFETRHGQQHIPWPYGIHTNHLCNRSRSMIRQRPRSTGIGLADDGTSLLDAPPTVKPGGVDHDPRIEQTIKGIVMAP